MRGEGGGEGRHGKGVRERVIGEGSWGQKLRGGAGSELEGRREFRTSMG